MLRVARFIVGCTLLFALGACASGLKFAQVNPGIEPAKTEGGRIFFYRPSAFGAAVRPDVQLNGQKVGEAISHGYFYVDRPAGDYQVVTSTEVERKLSFVLEKGQTRFVRFSITVGFFMGHVYGELVDQDVGLSEIKECMYTGDDPSLSKPQ